MKPTIIKKVKVSRLNAELNQPFTIASGSHRTVENVLIGIELADGTVGYGEAAPAPHITGETQAKTLANLSKIAGFLRGKDAAGYLSLLKDCSDILVPIGNRAALAAVEMAVLDAVTRHIGMPLYKIFGPTASRLATDITVVIGSVEEARFSAEKIKKRGVRSFKIKVGKDLDTDFKRVLAVAQVAGKLPVYLDANEGFTAAEILKFTGALKKKGVVPAFLEQPVPRKDWDGLKKVTRESGLCVGADESVSCLADAVRAIKEKAVNAINIKVMKFALLESREIARLCKSNGIKLMIGGMMESSLAMTCSAHLASGMGGFDFIDLDTPFFIKDRIMCGAGPSSSGIYDLSGVRSGSGVLPSSGLRLF